MLVPYRHLMDSEKTKGREDAIHIIRVVVGLGYDILTYNEIKMAKSDSVRKR